MPRSAGDFANNDDVYKQIEQPKRKKRTLEEMKQEADILRTYFKTH